MKKHRVIIITLLILGNILTIGGAFTKDGIIIQCTGLIIICMGLLATGLRRE